MTPTGELSTIVSAHIDRLDRKKGYLIILNWSNMSEQTDNKRKGGLVRVSVFWWLYFQKSEMAYILITLICL